VDASARGIGDRGQVEDDCDVTLRPTGVMLNMTGVTLRMTTVILKLTGVARARYRLTIGLFHSPT